MGQTIEAEQAYLEAARANDLGAQSALENLLLAANSKEKKAQAMHWLEQAALQDWPQAQYQ